MKGIKAGQEGIGMDRRSLCADDLEIINKYSNTVYRIAYALTKNRYDADDIHQEVFVRYINKRPQFESTEHENAWFLRVTVNLCKNFWKTAWKRKVIGLEDDLMEGAEITEETESDQVIDAVKKLPQKYRVVIHLFYYEELSVEEISKVLHAKPSTVRTHLTRARAKLKRLLENDDEKTDRQV